MSIIRFLLFYLVHLTSAQFSSHLDLQKVGEIIFNNEKYNVLKPTVHQVTDYFKHYMLRRENKSNERIFIDDNGFRHFWSGIGKKDQNLRKTEIYGPNIQIERTNQETKSNIETTTIRNSQGNTQGQSANKVAKTSFFCPFFGVITMTSQID